MRAFLDSNVLISAFTADGASSKLFDLLNERHTIIISPQVLREFRRITVDKFGADPAEVDPFITDVAEHSEICLPPYSQRFEVRDPDDIEILAAALKGKAEVLVTGDKDLLDIPNPPLPIVRPRQLYDLLTSE
ncbi:MAG: putative toxin-antitoxin system toxin component, PIN family [Bacteroidota bacterium]|nr:putative toxin-antitoxin system toxin component, PIN family [Bacteroidota bacterium]MDP4232757.1 putative toxin-antitoxin system toxin component, PIN family [Bacteroidota bacterium]MDP4242561.1 putative toxin-antitoxin system toxin component, PIN family [Bacteroidota bacterium]MDP4289378.1 putative toxin-antitoxin system toxin component, PIN family [Bacteroidota bacterium]